MAPPASAVGTAQDDFKDDAEAGDGWAEEGFLEGHAPPLPPPTGSRGAVAWSQLQGIRK